MTGYAIRPLEAADLAGISHVHYRAAMVAYSFMGWAYSEEQVRRWYATKMPHWDWGQVALFEDTIVALIAATRGHIDQLFVDPDHQRSGLGGALLAAMLDRSLRPATLTVHAENHAARRFYERFGFREAGAWWNESDHAVDLLYRLE